MTAIGQSGQRTADSGQRTADSGCLSYTRAPATLAASRRNRGIQFSDPGRVWPTFDRSKHWCSRTFLPRDTSMKHHMSMDGLTPHPKP